MLKGVLDTLDGVDEATQKLYVEKDGKYVLQVEGMVDKAQVDEFRTNNITLLQAQDTMKAELEKFKDIDPAAFVNMQNRLKEIDDKQLMDAGQFEELLKKRTEEMQKEHKNQLQALTTAKEATDTENANLNSSLSEQLIDNEARSVAMNPEFKLGVKSEAVSDIVGHVRQVYKLKEGKVTPMQDDGQVRYGKDGKNPMPMPEFIAGLRTPKPHYFEPNSGGGAGGSVDGGGTGEVIDPTNRHAISQNLKDIASGKKTVAVPE